jgi:hypothetical protein
MNRDPADVAMLLALSRIGFLVAIGRGYLLFSADAAHVVNKSGFPGKLAALIAAALINIVTRMSEPWRRTSANCASEASGGAKLTAPRLAPAVAGRCLRRSPDRLFLRPHDHSAAAVLRRSPRTH